MEAFREICAKKLSLDNYCDMEEYIFGRVDKREMLNALSAADSPFAALYKGSYPALENAAGRWEEFENAFLKDPAYLRAESDFQLNPLEAKAIVNWVYQAYKTIGDRKDATRDSLSAISELYHVKNLDLADCVIYVKSRIEINIITSFTGFLNKIQNIDRPEHHFYYRGHSHSNYVLLPSVMRKPGWLTHERDMYNEIAIECPDEFGHCSSHLDYLVHMQHYGLPTRLLDITRNPLVALYFACEQNPKNSGEVIVFDVEDHKIKYPGSDTVSILASLAQLTHEIKTDFSSWASNPKISQADFNKKASRLLHEIRLEKPAFRDEIHKEDVKDCFFVLSAKKNNRIIKQDGAFIICGLFDEKRNPINQYRYKEKKKTQVFIVKSKAKEGILKQLDKCSINKASLFPEISDVAEFIKQKY
ncbi:MAG: FRG domain-containing protein [Lacrimispora sp.]|uniref:FRG domain-containing protein n=1 Tax=Lacrimispora sp. TaxID=2719234 RepID=UPI0039E6C55F